MAKDIFHETVKTALIKDGWEITHDPYELKLDALKLLDARLNIDLGAERLIAATKNAEKIAVEVKSLLGLRLSMICITWLVNFSITKLALKNKNQIEFYS